MSKKRETRLFKLGEINAELIMLRDLLTKIDTEFPWSDCEGKFWYKSEKNHKELITTLKNEISELKMYLAYLIEIEE